jgi:alpha-L-rhamnosidase
MQGRIESDWKKDAAGFELSVRIPANASATVYLPARSAELLTEGGKPISQAQGVRLLKQEGSAAVLEVAAGHYTFRVAQPVN